MTHKGDGLICKELHETMEDLNFLKINKLAFWPEEWSKDPLGAKEYKAHPREGRVRKSDLLSLMDELTYILS